MVQPAGNGALGFDSDTVITPAKAQAFKALGYIFCARYLSLGPRQDPGDLTAAEAAGILAGGLALIAVQHVRRPGWSPGAQLGATDGANAAANAKAVGFPAGVNVWLDLEGVGITVSSQDVIDHCNAWHDAVAAAGFVPGLYVGANSVLDGEQLYDELSFEHYWKSESKVPELPQRGYQIVQSPVLGLVNGISIDEDLAKADSEGGCALWLIGA
jgi:hypothetical protein